MLYAIFVVLDRSTTNPVIMCNILCVRHSRYPANFLFYAISEVLDWAQPILCSGLIFGGVGHVPANLVFMFSIWCFVQVPAFLVIICNLYVQ